MNDKVLHFIAGFLIAMLFGWLTYPLFGFFMSALIGGLKEMFWDLCLDRGTPEMRDFVATIYGGIAGTIIIYVARMVMCL